MSWLGSGSMAMEAGNLPGRPVPVVAEARESMRPSGASLRVRGAEPEGVLRVGDGPALVRSRDLVDEPAATGLAAAGDTAERRWALLPCAAGLTDFAGLRPRLWGDARRAAPPRRTASDSSVRPRTMSVTDLWLRPLTGVPLMVSTSSLGSSSPSAALPSRT